MIISKNYIEDREEERVKRVEALVKNFNQTAIKQKSKYRILIQGLYAKLFRNGFLGFGTTISPLQLYYDFDNFAFRFIHTERLSDEILDEIESILEKIPEKFIIEIEK